MRNKITLATIIIGIAFVLSACSELDVQNAAKQLEEINSALEKAQNQDKFDDPEKLVDYLKGQNEEIEEEIPVEEPVYITYNVSQIGYMPDGDQYCVKVDTESGDPIYTIASCEEAKTEGAVVITKPNLYGNAAAEYMDNLLASYESYNDISEDELKNLFMNDADALLYLEYYQGSEHDESVSELAKKLTALVCKAVDSKSDMDSAFMYNTSAILAKSVYILDVQDSDTLKKLALDMWNRAEEDNSDNDYTNPNRAWAAAELYRMTRQKTYRTIIEAIESEDNLYGLSFDNPGYYAVFAYLSAEDNTDYDISGKMMNYFFNDINGKIKESKKGLLQTSIDPDNMIDGIPSDDFTNRIIDDCKLSLMANYISMSVEYTEFAKVRVTYITGANPVGTNYIDVEHMNKYNPALFVLCGLSQCEYNQH